MLIRIAMNSPILYSGKSSLEHLRIHFKTYTLNEILDYRILTHLKYWYKF